MKKHFVLILAIFIMAAASSAEALTIDWANIYSDANALDPERALGKPDGQHAMFGNNSRIVRTATYAGFGTGDTTTHDTATFAALLGISEETLATADFFSTEYSGGVGPYEGGVWQFSDGVNSLSVNHDPANPVYTGPIIAGGDLNNAAYADYFSFTNTAGSAGSWPYLLFDIDGYSSVNTQGSNFKATLTAYDIGGGTDPDPDVMGRIQTISNPVPEPATLSLFGLGIFGFLLGRKRKGSLARNA